MAKILVVDDMAAIRTSLREILIEENHEVEEAKDGEEALRKLEQDHFDVAFCDVKMPKMDGIEVLEKVKKAGINTPFIIISAHGTKETALECIKRGAYFFIQKPFESIETILIHLRNVLERNSLKEENKSLKKKISKGFDMIGESAPLVQVKEMIEASRSNKVFLMEAFWTKFLPQYQKVTELISAGAIGSLKMIQADFGFRAEQPTPQRLYDPKLGGGALLDIGIYPVFLAISLLGRPADIEAVMSPYPSGVDEQISAVLRFNNGAIAITSATFAAWTPVEATIVGTEGYIKMTNRFHNSVGNIEIANLKGSQPVAVRKEEGFGYQFEARHVDECLRKNLIESPIMSLADSLLLMETMDRIRAKCGIRYDVD